MLVEVCTHRLRKRKQRVTSCFSPEEGKHGWCGTCDEAAKPNSPGYCGFHVESKNEKEIPIITSNSTNWGFCNEHCLYPDSLKDEIKVRVVHKRRHQ